MQQLRADFRYAAAVLRRHDYETYLATSAIDRKDRAGPLAIRALNCETAIITGDPTSSSSIFEDHLDGQKQRTNAAGIAVAKLQWWKDRVEAMLLCDGILPVRTCSTRAAMALLE